MGAYDGILATAVKRQHEPQQMVGDLLTAEMNESRARSIKYQLTVAKLPLAKDLDDDDAVDINETSGCVTLPPAASSNTSAMSCSSAEAGRPA